MKDKDQLVVALDEESFLSKAVNCSIRFFTKDGKKQYSVVTQGGKYIAFVLPTGSNSSVKYEHITKDMEEQFVWRVWGYQNGACDFSAIFRSKNEGNLTDLFNRVRSIKSVVYMRGMVGERQIDDLPFYGKLHESLSDCNIELKVLDEKKLPEEEEFVILALYTQAPLGIPEEEMWEKWVAHAHSLCGGNAVWVVLKNEDYTHTIRRNALKQSGVLMRKAKNKQVPDLLRITCKSGYVVDDNIIKQMARDVIRLALALETEKSAKK